MSDDWQTSVRTALRPDAPTAEDVELMWRVRLAVAALEANHAGKITAFLLPKGV